MFIATQISHSEQEISGRQSWSLSVSQTKHNRQSWSLTKSVYLKLKIFRINVSLHDDLHVVIQYTVY
jgi:hypothetical protein